MQADNSNMDLYKRLLIRLILGIIYVGGILFLLPKIFKLLHPFIFALIIAGLLNPLVSKIHKSVSKIHKGPSRARKIITIILNLVILFIISSLIFYLLYTLIRELMYFSLSIQQNWSKILAKVDNLQESFTWAKKVFPPGVIEFLYGFRDSLLDLVKNTSKALLSSSITVTAAIITGAGNLFINFLTFFLAMYFLISDYHIIGDIIEKHSDKSIVKTCNLMKDSLVNAFGSFLRAQFIYAGFAFVFMFLSLKIYGISHALIIALLLGFVDLLPIIGTVAVLAPWGIIEYINGDIKKGLFLIIISLTYMLIRKIIEPKVVGSQTGLHPLLALMSTYLGLKFSGIWGAILGPLVLMVIISLVKSGIFKNTLEDLREFYFKMSNLLKR